MVAHDLPSNIEDAVCRSREGSGEEMISFLQNLVRILTVNPPSENNVEALMVVHAMPADEDCYLMQTISGDVEKLFGRTSKLTTGPGTYDQRDVVQTASLSQCIAYEPGILEEAHPADEYCVVEDVINSAMIMALTAMQLLGAEEGSSQAAR
jgi:succinyl-diaminopimelate desuccinylase